MTSVRRIFLASGAVALAASAILAPSAAFADEAVATTEATVAPQNQGNRAFTVSPKGPYGWGEADDQSERLQPWRTHRDHDLPRERLAWWCRWHCAWCWLRTFYRSG